MLFKKNKYSKNLSLIAIVILVLIESNTLTFASIKERLSENWRWVPYTVSSGLTGDKIVNIIETPAGTIWAVSITGFSWFDNFSWHTIKDPSLSLLKNTLQRSVHPDDKDGLILCYEGKVITVTRDGIKRHDIHLGNKEIKVVYAIVLSQESQMLLSETEDKKSRLYIYENSVLRETELPFDKNIPPGSIRLFRTKSGIIFLNCPAGLFEWIDNAWQLLVKSENSSILDMSEPVSNKKGKGFYNIGFPKRLRGIWEFKGNNVPVFSCSNNMLTQTIAINENDEAIAIYLGGLVEYYDKRQWSLIDNPPEQLINSTKILFSSEGDLWVATDDILYLCKLSTKRWTYWYSNNPEKRAFINEIIRSRDRSVWIASGAGVEQRSPDGKIKFTGRIQNTILDGVTGLAEDKHGYIWISSGGSFTGAFRWDGKRWESISNSSPLTRINIHKIKIDLILSSVLI